jgi:fructuronate reductase
MVDRIVPASTPQTLAAAENALGCVDLAAVAAEPYAQWVIEDDFPGGRPAWERAGAVLTDDAGPWERLKLRALNGLHSAAAYLGALAGRETIAEALTIPGLAEALRRLVAEEVAASFTPPAGVSVVDYGEQVLARFANPAIRHRTLQVAMDGSQKLPQRVLHTIADLRAAGRSARWCALVVAAWMRFVVGYADDGTALPLDDPLADRIRAALATGGGTPGGAVDALLGLREVFPAEVAEDAEVRAEITGWLTDLRRHGVAAILAGVA